MKHTGGSHADGIPCLHVPQTLNPKSYTLNPKTESLNGLETQGGMNSFVASYVQLTNSANSESSHSGLLLGFGV